MTSAAQQAVAADGRASLLLATSFRSPVVEYHGLGHRHGAHHRSLVRPQLNSGTLAGQVKTPRFPAIAICPGDSFLVAHSLAQLEAASPAAVRSGYFDRLYLFDSDGRRWRVSRFTTTSARPTGPFGKLVGVDLAFATPDVPRLSEIADALCHLVDSDSDDLYGQFVTRDKLKALFRSSATIGDLIGAASTLGA